MKKKKLKLMNIKEDQELNRYDMKSIMAGCGGNGPCPITCYGGDEVSASVDCCTSENVFKHCPDGGYCVGTWEQCYSC